MVDLNAKEVADRLAKTGIDTAQIRYGVRAHRIVYRTVDITGRPTTASELVAMPKNDERDLQVVSWLHGTEVYRGEVASVNDESTDRATALLFASTGRAVSARTTSAWARAPDSTRAGTRRQPSAPRWMHYGQLVRSPAGTATTWTSASSSAGSLRADPPR
ncbi:hypothetical protein [Streptomyces sp. MMS24-I29]|uniref:hypothetical protein n=1 Tax=Streptomyces sp. MMS24-I29 TaxID=3351480 RepID=UPI003C7CA020